MAKSKSQGRTNEHNKKRSLGSQYKSFMTKYPLIGNAVQAALINAAGVLTSQAIPMLSGRPVIFNWTQVVIFMLIGAVVITPLIIYVLIGTIFAQPMTKFQLLIASTVFGTFVINGAFVVSLGFFEELLDPSQDICLKPIVARVFTSGFLKGALESRIVFFPADVLTIFFVPPMLQPLVGNLAGYIWTIVLAFRSK